MSQNKYAPIILLITLYLALVPAMADFADDAKGVKLSGGAAHTLALTNDKSVWACGPNGDPEPWYAVLGRFYITCVANLSGEKKFKIGHFLLETPMDLCFFACITEILAYNTMERRIVVLRKALIGGVER